MARSFKKFAPPESFSRLRHIGRDALHEEILWKVSQVRPMRSYQDYILLELVFIQKLFKQPKCSLEYITYSTIFLLVLKLAFLFVLRYHF